MEKEMNLTDSMMTMMRQMSFHFSSTVPGGLLFKQWTVDSVGDLVGAIIAVFVLAIFYEALKTLREYLIFVDYRRRYKHKKCRRREMQTDKTSLIVSEDAAPPPPKGIKYYSISLGMHLLQSVLHVVQVGYGYILMLVIMTFNGWLFLSVCFGAGMGYLLFASSRHLMDNFRDQNEQCH